MPAWIPVIPLVLGTVSAVFVTLKQWTHRRAVLDNWLEGARLFGLRDLVPHHGFLSTSLVGSHAGLEVSMSFYSRDDRRGTTLRIRDPRQKGEGLTLRPECLRTAVEKRLLGATETRVGDPWFDQQCFVEGPPELAMAALSAPVRREVNRLLLGSVEVNAYRDIDVRGSITNGEVRLEIPERAVAPGSEAGEVLPGAVRLAIGLQPPADLVDRLCANLREEPVARVRLRLVETLARRCEGDARTREALLSACQDPDCEVRLAAALALGADGRAILEALVASPGPSDDTRARALGALGPRVGVELVESTLADALDERADATARACLEALRRFRRQEAEALVQRALASLNPDVATSAALALRACGTIASIPALLELAGSGASIELRAAARQTVGAIQARQLGAAPGQLSLADDSTGALTLVDAEPAGRLSLTEPGGAARARRGPSQAFDRSR